MSPPPSRTAVEWAERERVLPPWSPVPGPFRFRLTPYVPPILRACDDPDVHEVVVLMGAQMSKTEGVDLNLLGQRLDDDPVPAIVVFPTQHAAENQFEPRLMEMLRAVPSLAAKTPQAKRYNLKTRKTIGGVTVRLAWAGSPTELASQAAGLVILDEFDRMEAIKGEGDPLQLVRARGAAYPDFTLVVTSTPLQGAIETGVHPATGLEHWAVADADELQSKTWRLWQQGTRREWAWPCPECARYFIPRLSRLRWPKDATPVEAERTARLECPHCHAQLDDARKTEMNAAGVYVSPGQSVVDGVVVGDGIMSDRESYWVSGLCSPWRTFGKAARQFLEAMETGDPETMQPVINTVFGECFSIAGEALPWERLRALCAEYESETVPEGVRLLTLGVDKQHDRLYYELRGWGVRLVSWQIACGELLGDTTRAESEVWADLDVLRASIFDGLPVALTCVDSGDDPGPVYAYVRRSQGQVRATKSWAKRQKPISMQPIDLTVGGRTIKQGLQLWHLDSDVFKTFIHARFPRGDGEQPTGWHVPRDVRDEYLQQLAAERRVVTRKGEARWLRIRKANHWLDAAALTVAAAYMLQAHRWTQESAPGLPVRRAVVAAATQTPAAAAAMGSAATARRPVVYRQRLPW